MIYQMLLVLQSEVLCGSLRMGTITSETSIRHPPVAITEGTREGGGAYELDRDACPRN